MTDHPLTDEILISRFLKHARKFNSYTFDYTADGMRAAYDKGMEDQLEQVIKWIQDNIQDQDYKWHYVFDSQIEDLKKAMRLTTTIQEDN